MKQDSLESKILFPTKWVDENCWYWLGQLNKSNPSYVVKVEGKRIAIRVRRLMWEINIVDNKEKPITKRDVIISVCGDNLCVNPSHLKKYTKTEALDLGYLNQAQRTQERFAKITHCPRGHEYTEENTAYNTGKWATNRTRTYKCRYCKTCNRERAARRKLKLGATRLVKDYEGRGLLTTELMDIIFKRPIRKF